MSASGHNLYSSYREMVLEHLFVGGLMRHLWLKDFGRVEMLKSQVDDSGYDLVFEANDVVRHVQLKSSQYGAATAGHNIQLALAKKPSGCVIWMRFDPETLHTTSFLWFGGAPGEKLPDMDTFKVTKSSKANSQGVKTERPNLRWVPKARFSPLTSIDEVVAHLFGEPKVLDS